MIRFISFHFLHFFGEISVHKRIYPFTSDSIQGKTKRSEHMNEWKKETRLNMYMKSEWKTNYSIKSIVNIYKAVFTNQNVVNRVHYRSSRLKCDKIVSLSFSICYRVPEAVLHVYIWCLHAKLSMCTYVGQFSLVFFYLCCFCFCFASLLFSFYKRLSYLHSFLSQLMPAGLKWFFFIYFVFVLSNNLDFNRSSNSSFIASN